MSKLLNAFAFLDQISKTMTNEDKIQERFYDILGDISIAIVNYREKNKMNQKQLAEFMNVTQPMIVKYERGDHNFTIKTLNEVCGKLGFDLCIKVTDAMSTKEKESDGVPEITVDAA